MYSPYNLCLDSTRAFPQFPWSKINFSLSILSINRLKLCEKSKLVSHQKNLYNSTNVNINIEIWKSLGNYIKHSQLQHRTQRISNLNYKHRKNHMRSVYIQPGDINLFQFGNLFPGFGLHVKFANNTLNMDTARSLDFLKTNSWTKTSNFIQFFVFRIGFAFKKSVDKSY